MSLGWIWTSRLQGPPGLPGLMPRPSSRADWLRRGEMKGIHPLDGLLAGVPLDDRQQVALHGRTAGHDVAAGEEALSPVEIGDHAAGLAHQQDAGGDVPGRKAELE